MTMTALCLFDVVWLDSSTSWFSTSVYRVFSHCGIRALLGRIRCLTSSDTALWHERSHGRYHQQCVMCLRMCMVKKVAPWIAPRLFNCLVVFSRLGSSWSSLFAEAGVELDVALDVVRRQRATLHSHRDMSRRVGCRRNVFVLHPHFFPYQVIGFFHLSLRRSNDLWVAFST